MIEIRITPDDGLLREVRDGQRYIVALLRELVARSKAEMAKLTDLTDGLTGLAADVSAEKDAESAIIALLNGLTAQGAVLQQQLADAIKQGDPAVIQQALDAITANRAAVQANTATLAAATVANTPAGAPAPPPVLVTP
jgi:hypothetical protein